MDILRFITAGNIDDGKSTLIGRLLHDTNNIKSDVLQSVSTENDNSIDVNLAHITDGLRSEREQGITIDIAYKYFTTPHRKYIITDAPGHFQYTKNLVTGASSVDAIIILIDAQHGITEQTRRHSLVASFLKIKQVFVAINKMDKVGYDSHVFNRIKQEYQGIAEKLKINNVTFIPISALYGDNVSTGSEKMNWYEGRTLLQYLESCEPASLNKGIARFSVQYVINKEERCYAGKMLSGSFKVNDVVDVYSGNEKAPATITRVIHGYDEVLETKADENVSICLNTEALRGSLISYPYNAPKYTNEFEAKVCWLDSENPLLTNKEYLLRIGAIEIACKVSEVIDKIDISSFEEHNKEQTVSVNEFATVKIKTEGKITFDPYTLLPENGRGILIYPSTNYTSGAFVIN